MAVSISILSWNGQILGQAKAGRDHLPVLVTLTLVA